MLESYSGKKKMMITTESVALLDKAFPARRARIARYLLNTFCTLKGRKGARGGAVGWGTAPQDGRSRDRFSMVSLEFFIDIILSATYGPGGDSASNINECQEYFLGGKGGWCVRLTTFPPSCADCFEIWEP